MHCKHVSSSLLYLEIQLQKKFNSSFSRKHSYYLLVPYTSHTLVIALTKNTKTNLKAISLWLKHREKASNLNLSTFSSHITCILRDAIQFLQYH